MIKAREDRLDWEGHHMLLAFVTSMRSPDPNTQVGACIVDKKNRVMGLGYNGPPRGIPVDSMPWDREGNDPAETKYAYVVHAEANAILNCGPRKLEGSTLFVTLYPCSECMKLIISSGIRKVYYLCDKYPDSWQHRASRKMAEQVDLVTVQYQWKIDPQWLAIKISQM